MGRPGPARVRAIEDFAAVLSGLRESAGTPSFRAMAGRSGAISHTTLHEAAQGNRLPSWETTVEFIRACGTSPGDYRERWERASAIVCAARREVTPRLDEAPAFPPGLGAAPENLPEDLDGHRPRWYAVAALATALALVTGGGVAWFAANQSLTGRSDPLALMANECPVNQKNPPPAKPEHQGDRAAFITDLTLSDCTHVPEGQTLTKSWRFKNKGTVPWDGYTLHRIDLPQQAGQCQTIPDVPIPRTAPGDIVDIEVGVTTPRRPTFCFVRFKMRDADGAVAFPGSRPVYFQVIVD